MAKKVNALNAIPKTHLFYRLMASPRFCGEGQDLVGTPFKRLRIEAPGTVSDIPAQAFIQFLSALEGYSQFCEPGDVVKIEFEVGSRPSPAPRD